MRTLLLTTACVLIFLALLTPNGAADPPRSDAHGDPLPDGVLARLGTLRWRADGMIVLTAFLPDGKSLLTVSHDCLAQVWERDGGKELRRFDAAGAALGDPTVAFLGARRNKVALSGDGKVLACPGRDGAIHLWDVSRGKELAKIGDGRAANQLALSPDGKTLAVTLDGPKTTLWDTTTARELRSFGEPTPTSRFIPYKMTFGPDGKALVQVGDDVGSLPLKTGAIVWDAANGKELQRYTDPVAGQAALRALQSAVSSDAKLLALPSRDKVKLIDLATGKEVRQLDGGDRRSGLVFSPDGKLLVALANRNAALIVWDTATGKTIHQHGEREPLAPGVTVALGLVPSGLAVSADGKLLAWGDGLAVQLVDLTTGQEKNASAGHAADVRVARFGPDGKTLLTWGGHDLTIRRWDAASGKAIGQIAVPSQSHAFVIPSQDERVLAAGDADGTLHLYDAASGKEKHILKPVPPSYGQTVACSPDSRLLAVVSMGGEALRLYEVATGKEKHALPLPSAPSGRRGLVAPGVRPSRRIAFSPDGRLVAVMDGNVVLWDVATGREVEQLGQPREGTVVRDIAFSPDGRTLAVDTNVAEIGLWEIASGQKRLTVNPLTVKPEEASWAFMTVVPWGVNATTIALSPAGRLLAQTDQSKARLWDLRTGKEVRVFDGHRGLVYALAFAPDGKRLATGSLDSTGLIWDVEPVLKTLSPLTATLPKEKLDSLWTALEGSDAAKAYEAICSLAGDPARSVPFLAKHVKPTVAPDAKHVARLIAALDAQDFGVRETAHKELEGLGELALAPLRKALKESPSAEQKRALNELVQAADSLTLSGERLRLMRALEALEMARTADAVKVLKTVAAGASDTLPTTQAQAILKRLGE
jgi:WD40 repeat protein